MGTKKEKDRSPHDHLKQIREEIEEEEGGSKILSVRLPEELAKRLEQLEKETGFKRAILIRLLLLEASVDLKKRIERDSVEVPKSNDQTSITRANKGEVLANRFLQDILFSDWSKDGRSTYRRRWEN